MVTISNKKKVWRRTRRSRARPGSRTGGPTRGPVSSGTRGHGSKIHQKR